MIKNLKSCAGFAWDTFVLFVVFMLILALPAYAKLPVPKAKSCEDKALFILQVIHAKQRGLTLDDIKLSVSQANEKYADPDIKTEELITAATWAFVYRGTEDNALHDFLEICLHPVEL